ncbi:hypothetical protein [Nostoc sp. NMS4]|nr:hypothetical protein [Nostoc sp. NMS4]MBN3925936.1 hypothetical protein [Nostoc sp. NMS4]
MTNTKNRQSLIKAVGNLSVFPINDSARVQLSLIMPSYRSLGDDPNHRYV